ncbi:hypothetical protein AS9A_2794 [Hoyosella subflava DQS3-9A1]|uniref:Uncharacterized protein n=1 Tax=Hoyosella subflava (strain DSM 45089 / JCM 17490 / NBRC 109087 / DQS3-9A1) TaxID=443218 RepID=F6EJ10_HOYSD|nr:hypothetical protein AS9A_2794 [Hoyosella subflava DQS3-9A1]
MGSSWSSIQILSVTLSVWQLALFVPVRATVTNWFRILTTIRAYTGITVHFLTMVVFWITLYEAVVSGVERQRWVGGPRPDVIRRL